MKFTHKMVMTMLLIGLLPVILVATVAIHIASGSLERQAFNQLESVRENKTFTVKQYLSTLTNQVALMAGDPNLQDAVNTLSTSFAQVLSDKNQTITSDVLLQKRQSLKAFYESEFAPRLTEQDPNHGLGDTSQLVDQLSDTAVLLQDAYLVKNPHPIGSKNALMMSSLNTSYDIAHSNVHA